MLQPPDPPVQTELRDPSGPALATEAGLDEIRSEIGELRQGVERIAAHLVPLLGEHHRATERRARELEQQILHRRERPVAVRIGHLLSEVQRLVDADQARAHTVEGLQDVLFQLGYEQFGEPGEEYDPDRHEAIEGSSASATTCVERVFSRGLWSFGDVVVRARVAVGTIEPSPQED